ncbi:MAG: DnaJ domain-containing protein, partial [Bdellovibrionales bacterium]|nr:DnaJ domain-containing protein [Bdellovibrionales bacterium]
PKKDIQKAINDKNSYAPMGQKLIQDGLLSPHLVSFILKEQIKIRISQIISSRSFTVEVIPKSVEVADEAVTFNEQDFMEWSIDCIKTKFTAQWMQTFFNKNKDNFIQPADPIRSHFNHPFIKNYQALFDKITKSSTLYNIVRELSPKISNQKITKINAEDYRIALEIIYFGIITQSLQIRTMERIMKKSKKLEHLADTILQCEPNDLFLIFGLPDKASEEKVTANYKQIVKLLHPDKYPPNISDELKEKCHKAFTKATESHETLTDSKKRDLYLKKTDDSTFINIISLYEEGLQALYSENYTLAVHLFSKIQGKPKAPGNTMLYMIWAQIKASPAAMKDKTFCGNIKKQISAIPNEERVSYMFWFINGIYCSYTGNYEQALSLLKKALELKKDFKEAKAEYTRAKLMLDKNQPVQSLSNNKGGILSKFFKTG